MPNIFSRKGWGSIAGTFSYTAQPHDIQLGFGITIPADPRGLAVRSIHASVYWASGAAPGPWRLFVLAGDMPTDLTPYTSGLLSNSAIPLNAGSALPASVLFEKMLQSVSDVNPSGTVEIINEIFPADGTGPAVDGGDSLTILLCPLMVTTGLYSLTYASLAAYGGAIGAASSRHTADGGNVRALPPGLAGR